MKCSWSCLASLLPGLALAGCSGAPAPPPRVSPKVGGLPQIGLAPAATPSLSYKPQGTPNLAVKTSTAGAGFALWAPVPLKAQALGSASLLERSSRMFIGNAKSITYMVLATTLPATERGKQPQAFIDGVQRGILDKSKAKLLKRTDFSQDGLPARDLSTSLNNGAEQTRVAIFLAPTAFYQIVVIAPKKAYDANTANTEKFIRSFRVN